MKKVCLVIHSLGIGGMERVMSQLANNFSKRENTQVDIILIGKKKEVVFDLSSFIRVHRPSFQFKNSSRTLYTLRIMWFLRSKVRGINPDTILSFGEYWNNLVLLSLFGLSYPVFISDRSEPAKDLGKIQNFLRDRLYPRAAGFIAQTEEAKKVCLSRRWNHNVQIIGNPIRQIKQNGYIGKENIVLSMGRLIKTKHFDHLIRMFVEIGNPEWKLVIVGGDAKNLTLSKELKKLIHQLNAKNSVFLEGEQKEIDSYYRKSKIFAFTSSSEGFPNVLGEALSAGLPVISYDCKAGPSDLIVDGENGFLIPPFDTELFKEKLKLLMEDEGMRKQMENEAAISIDRFTPDSIIEKYYQSISDTHQIN